MRPNNKIAALLLILTVTLLTSAVTACQQTNIFPLVRDHVHGSTIVELPNSDLLAAWFQGSGERWADDVVIMGSRLRKGDSDWSAPFLMADVAEFPDINPVLFLDPDNRLWLIWYTVIANQWETSLLRFRISDDYRSPGPPHWTWQDCLLVKPGGPTERGIQPDDPFVKTVERKAAEYAETLTKTDGRLPDAVVRTVEAWKADLLARARGDNMTAGGRLYKSDGSYEKAQLGYPYFRRMGWQTKNKPFISGDRIIIPLYSDGFSFSLMAITDDKGETWQFSEPLVGGGNIQPSIARTADGKLVAYMRDNGPPPNRLHVSTSIDNGMTWSTVRDSQLPNPGSGADIVTLRNGHWALACNDTTRGRHSLAVKLSTDEGRTWPHTKHLILDTRSPDKAATGAYPAIIQTRDGRIHVTYSYDRKDRQPEPHKSIRHAVFDEQWITGN